MAAANSFHFGIAREFSRVRVQFKSLRRDLCRLYSFRVDNRELLMDNREPETMNREL
jgi:hypothetical protein